MAESDSPASASFDFQRARRRAGLRSVMAQLRGEDARLLSYEDVRRRLRAVEGAEHTLEDVPIAAIVGSVGRYQDFTREFLPLVDEDIDRWVGVRLAMTGLEGVPPVELYRIGEAYFVKDGNHRVSVARQLGARTINAYVTPVRSRVPLGSDPDYEALILATEYATFLERTGIDELRPDADLRVTEAGQYPRLAEHIGVHRYFMGIDRRGPVPWEEAVAHWYDTVYLPVAAAIRKHDLLARFPDRTEADLYLFLSQHRGDLEKRFGWSLEGFQLAEGLSASARFDEAARSAQLRAAAEAGTPVQQAMAGLIDAVLVISDGGVEESATAHGLHVAAVERATLLGLRLGTPASPGEELATKERFERLCADRGVRGQLAYAEGNKVSAVLARAAYVDLVVVGAPRPAGAGRALLPGARGQGQIAATLLRTLTRRQSWLRSLIHRCEKPLLVVRSEKAGFSRPLLAYDGGERARQALFWLAYLCLSRGLKPRVVTVPELVGGDTGALDTAGAYLGALGLEAELIRERGAVDAAILSTAERFDCDLILMGSYK
ncbi:MAG TPA: universal stress protein, partial [Trueperaceae bacterium]|nr:universal stress protein [Trueperaceae bacterium]